MYIENVNTFQYLDSIVRHVTENLKFLIHAPSVQLQDVPPDFFDLKLEEEIKEQSDPDVRVSAQEADSKYV